MNNTIWVGTLVADKRQIRKTIKRIQRVKTWQLVVLLILAVFIAATFLRLNNIGMVERRNAVISADAAGIDTVTGDRLYDLQQYVSSHMNTNMNGGLYLTSSYKRDTKAAIQAADSENNPNGNIYVKAQQTCDPHFTRWSEAYVQCTVAALATYPAASNLTSALNLPPVSLYLRDYVSPVWSPDFAGWSVVVCIVLGLMIIVRIVSLIILRLLVRRNYKSI
jgi:hypothetical protein